MAASYNANTDRLAVTAFDLPATGSFSAWAYPTFAYNDSVEHVIFGADNGAGGNQFLVDKASDNNWYCGWQTASTDYRVITSASNMVQNSWNHLLVTWDDTANETKFYLNGSQQGSTVTSLATFTGFTRVEIGNYPGTNLAFNTGRLAEWAVFNRVLNAGEITALSKRFSPMLLRPSKYAPLIRTFQELIAGVAISNTSVDVLDHLPMIYPSSRKAA